MKSLDWNGSQSGQIEPQWTWGMTAVVCIAGILFLARLGERALWSEEVRWAEIPREMLLQADFFQPTINGKSYYDKPLGSYWLVILASYFTGGVNELAARLPSALAGWLGVLFLMLLARRLYDAQTAVWAGLILATSFSFLFFSRHASTDIETVTGILAVLWLFVRFPSPHWTITIALWVLMALTSLTKGLLGFVLPILIMTMASLMTPSVLTGQPKSGIFNRIRELIQRNQWFLRWATLPGMLLALAIYLCPFLISLLQTGSTEGLDMVFRENIRRFYAPVNHRGPVYLYCYIIFLLLAPWSILLPAALIHTHRQRNGSENDFCSDRFTLSFFWSTFIFFTLASSRRSYYLLPILPACALLIARLLTSKTHSSWVVMPMIRGIQAVLAITLVLGIGILVFLPYLTSFMPLLQYISWRGPLGLMMTLCLIVWIRSWKTFSIERFRIGFAMTTLLAMGYGYLILWPDLDTLRTQKDFARQVLAIAQLDDQQLVLYRNRDIVYYLGKPHPIKECHDLIELHEIMKKQSVRWLIARQRDLSLLPVHFKEIVKETTHSWEEKKRLDAKLVLLEFVTIN